ncbi:hypothetical protein [Paraflavitalea pollutisoli]|uniref:hypothetical protein n=1 Tax=Paraflavitalea pollutisoli TaxID=3034143 RepID=UPI0023EB293D|nr:hypothetical protein [Paraflavitalea sp. H1-2-19X]
MSTSKNTEKKSKPLSKKKETRAAVSEQLTTTLTDLKETLGQKKFARRIKKAARLLTEGIKAKAEKKEKKEQKEKKVKKVKAKTKTNKANKVKKAVAVKAVAV